MTYRLSDDARKCIATVHGAIWDGECPQHTHMLPPHCPLPCCFTCHCLLLDRALWRTQGCQAGCAAGKQVKACYGTTKYCNAFLKGIPCNNTDCLYLHAEGEPPSTRHAAAWACARHAPHSTCLAHLKHALTG